MTGDAAAGGWRCHTPAERRRGVLLALIGIAIYCAMDAAMKALAMAHGAATALFWRNMVSLAVLAPLGALLLAIGRWRWPERGVLALHVQRGLVGAAMAVLFFWALARMPMAEAIALSFVSPLIAHALAWWRLGEHPGRGTGPGTLLGLAGVAVIIGPRLGGGSVALAPVAAVLASAALFAWNLILARRQALAAGPFEVAAIQSGVMALALLPVMLATGGAAPPAADWPMVALAAACATGALMILARAYALAEAQVLIPTEYSALPWAAVMGWWVFGEPLTWPVLAGAGLIGLGVRAASRR